MSKTDYLTTERIIKKKTDMRSIFGSIFIYGIMLIIILFSIYPLIWVLISSTKTNYEVLSSALALPSHLTINNYISVFKNTPVMWYFMNSVIICSVATVFAILVYGMAAYVTARYDFKLKNAVIAMIASTMFIPGIALSFPIYRLVKLLHMYNTRQGLALVYLSISMAMAFFIIRSYILSIPVEMDEAAFIDGAGFFRIYFQIIMPLALPGISTAAIVTILGCWNDFYWANLLTSGEEVRTIPVTMYAFMSKFRTNLGATFAAIVIMLTPTIIFYVIASEQITKSLTDGAVKG